MSQEIYTYDIVEGRARGIPRYLFQISDVKTVLIDKAKPVKGSGLLLAFS